MLYLEHGIDMEGDARLVGCYEVTQEKHDRRGSNGPECPL